MELVGLAKRLVNSYPHELDGGGSTENWNCKSACAESENLLYVMNRYRTCFNSGTDFEPDAGSSG